MSRFSINKSVIFSKIIWTLEINHSSDEQSMSWIVCDLDMLIRLIYRRSKLQFLRRRMTQTWSVGCSIKETVERENSRDWN